MCYCGKCHGLPSNTFWWIVADTCESHWFIYGECVPGDITDFSGALLLFSGSCSGFSQYTFPYVSNSACANFFAIFLKLFAFSLLKVSAGIFNAAWNHRHWEYMSPCGSRPLQGWCQRLNLGWSRLEREGAGEGEGEPGGRPASERKGVRRLFKVRQPGDICWKSS